MQSDLPHTLLSQASKPQEPEKNTKASDEVLRLQEEANREFLDRQKGKAGEGYEIDELFT